MKKGKEDGRLGKEILYFHLDTIYKNISFDKRISHGISEITDCDANSKFLFLWLGVKNPFRI